MGQLTLVLKFLLVIVILAALGLGALITLGKVVGVTDPYTATEYKTWPHQINNFFELLQNHWLHR